MVEQELTALFTGAEPPVGPSTTEDIPDYSYLSRFQFISGPPQQLPFHCAGCKGYDGLFLDINLEIEFYGKIYWCWNCIVEIAQQIGFKPEQQWSLLNQKIEQLDNVAFALRKENEDLRNALDSLNRVFSNPVIDSAPGVVAVEEPAEQSGGGDETVGGSPAGEESPPKSSNVKGSSKLSDNAGDIASLLDGL